MTSNSIDTEISTRICNHMNRDHRKALIAYAKYYGKLPKPENAKLTEISSSSMQLEVDGSLIRIAFDHILKDSQDAHQTLVTMLKAIPKEITESAESNK